MAARPSALEFMERQFTMVEASGLCHDKQEAERERKT